MRCGTDAALSSPNTAIRPALEHNNNLIVISSVFQAESIDRKLWEDNAKPSKEGSSLI